MPFSPKGYSTTWDYCSQQHTQPNAPGNFADDSAIFIGHIRTKERLKLKDVVVKGRRRIEAKSVPWLVSHLVKGPDLFHRTTHFFYHSIMHSVRWLKQSYSGWYREPQTVRELHLDWLVIETLTGHLGDLGAFPLQAQVLQASFSRWVSITFILTWATK